VEFLPKHRPGGDDLDDIDISLYIGSVRIVTLSITVREPLHGWNGKTALAETRIIGSLDWQMLLSQKHDKLANGISYEEPNEGV
jgi:hypothetical protein